MLFYFLLKFENNYLFFRLVGIRIRLRRFVYVIVVNFNMFEVLVIVNFKVVEVVSKIKDGFMEIIKKFFINRLIWLRIVL